MFGYGSRSSAHDVSRRIEALQADIAHLGEALADMADETTRAPRREARRFAHEAADQLTHRAEELGAHAGALVSSGLAAVRGRRRELDSAAARAQDAVMRHPGTTLAVAVGVGLAMACVLSWASRQPRR